MSEAPESVKYHGGYDPSDPPIGDVDDTPFSETCVKCGEACNPDESVYDETAKTWTCCNCPDKLCAQKPARPDQQTSPTGPGLGRRSLSTPRQQNAVR